MSTASTQVNSPQPGRETNNVTTDNTARNAQINNPTGDHENSTNDGGKPKGDIHLGPDDEITPEQAEQAGLPEQKHAGKVGFGPEYANQTRPVSESFFYSDGIHTNIFKIDNGRENSGCEGGD